MARLRETLARAEMRLVIAGLALSLLAVPAARLAAAPVNASLPIAFTVLAATALLAGVSRTFCDGSLPLRIAGVVAFLLGLWLIDAASYPGSGFVVGILAGAGIGAFLPRTKLIQPVPLATAAILAALFWFLPAVVLLAAAAVISIGVAVDGYLAPREGSFDAWLPRTALSSMILWGAFSIFWVGSTAPGVTWFGSVTAHGPRSSNQIAITFDDGPNSSYTLQIAQILEDHGVRGTFFEVGKAIVQQPDVTQELVARGHTVGNHSYNHGAVSYLNPFYPELDQTQKVFATAIGKCPTLFRPPHGTHTPFMSRIVDGANMRLINWDASAQDWVENDPKALTANILAKVKPGSIILLHDGIDGNPGADRSVVIKALNDLLDGLEAKGYQLVTVDKLLGMEPYQPCK